MVSVMQAGTSLHGPPAPEGWSVTDAL